MKKAFYFLFLFLFSIQLSAQNNLEQLKKQLEEAESTVEKMNLNFDIGKLLIRSRSYKEANDYTNTAVRLAKDLKDRNMEAQAAYQMYEVNQGLRNESNQNYWLNRALTLSKAIGDSDLIIKSTIARSNKWTKKGNYRQAYLLNQEAFEYFSAKGTSMSELERKFALEEQRLKTEKANLESQRNALTAERDTLSVEIEQLKLDKEQLSTDKETLEGEKEELTEANKQARKQVTEKTEKLDSVSEVNTKIEAIKEQQTEEIDQLSRDNLEKNYIIEKAKNEIMQNDLKLAEQKQYLYGAGIALISLFLISMLLYSRFKTKKKAAKLLAEKNEIIEVERLRSDKLLKNILPDEIAEELKSKGKADAKHFKNVTVFFSDFKNFTTIAEKMSPAALVTELDTIFSKFDEIIEKYPDIEKIKTIGDSYMCASGFSDRTGLPTNIVKASLEMQAYLDTYKKQRILKNKPFFEARMGLHSGPVVAGVVGSKKFAYDIWGDTVNTASRMESNSVPGRVNISQTTYNQVKYGFKCSHRGKVQAKNKGQIDMYFVEKPISN